MVMRASSILPSRACASARRVRISVIATLLPASARPAKPWRISETPSPAAAELRPRPAYDVAGYIP